MRISKNYLRGERVVDLRVLLYMAQQKESVCVRIGTHHFIRPAAFMINWSLAMLLKAEMYYIIKSKES